jgi:hypothetical protein
VEHDFPNIQFTRHFSELLGVVEGLSKLPKHYHVTQ